MKRDLVLVLDDYHLVEAADVHEGMTLLLEHQPPQLHVVLATRTDPPLPLARIRARGQLTEVRAADLRFTVEESAAYLNDAMLGSDLDGPGIARALSVSLSTVRTHTRSIYAKLGVSSRRAAVRQAHDLNLLPGPRRG